MATVRQPPEKLVDGKLQLRRWRSDDADALHTLVNRSLPELSPWMPWAANGYSKEDAVETLRLGSDGWDAGEEYEYAIIVDDQIRGSCRLVKRGGPGVLELGYWLGSGETGRGLATRASALLVGVAFDLEADCVEIRNDESNLRSALIPQRLGFSCLGPREIPAWEQQLWEQQSDSVGRSDILWRLDRDKHRRA
ncbi:acetyltransferase [Trichoderma arundinaceum]|uniref:Acetyltransferase n=1 Tax=Trichoderma arundinaceum TaxID=490622 RepID=A0A395NHJ8_TRIAR|nr:acetyltransferase [Trichoderma arundinaceum]